ncbi:MAG TPA: flagellar biosynthesis anti-sigma factor FlgM [Planctomycetaceae bacterium]|nr:flagellar biosynthesis anti-sigma factor FlgM [Planctomycetaceae bacterium]
MDVRSLGSVNAAAPARPAVPAEPATPVGTQPISTQDQVEISPAARLLETAGRSPEIRAERLNQIKAEIEAGTYETPEKLEAALVRLFEEAGLRLDEE